MATAKRIESRSANPSATRNADRTRESILRHATREFANRGFGGARVDSIAARCRLSKNTLYYHFGSKDGLITAVLQRMYETLRARQTELPSDAHAALKVIAAQTFRAFADSPEMIRLLNEENLYRASHIKKAEFLRSLYDPLFQALRTVLKDGADGGLLKPDLDPVQIYITMSSMAYHFISNGYTLELALDRDLSSDDAYELWEAHIVDVVITYCALVPSTRR